MDFLRVLMVFLSFFSERRRTQFRSQLSAKRGTWYHNCYQSKISPENSHSCLDAHILDTMLSTILSEEATSHKELKEIKQNRLILRPPGAHHHSKVKTGDTLTSSNSEKERWRTRGRVEGQEDQPVTSSRFTSSSKSAVMEDPSSSPAFLPWRLRICCLEEVQCKLT